MAEQLRLEDALGTFHVRGAPPPPAIATVEIVRLQAAGMGPTAISKHLNARGIPTPSRRGRWYPQTVLRHVEPGRSRWAAQMRQYRARQRGLTR